MTLTIDIIITATNVIQISVTTFSQELFCNYLQLRVTTGFLHHTIIEDPQLHEQ